MGDVPATLVADIDDAPDVPGAIELRIWHDDPEVAGIGFVCPCGCGKEGWLPFQPAPSPSWDWDGNKEAPTLTPSVLQRTGCKWHGWLTAGVWKSA